MIKWKDKREFWITGAKLADPEAGKIKSGSVLIQKGRISELAWQGAVQSDLPQLDIGGLVLSPGFIDIHTHLREPGYEEKETIETGTAAAAAGGYTAVVCMANTEPVVDDPSIVKFILEKSAQVSHCRVYITAALTRNLEGVHINEYHLLREAGAVALSDDGKFVVDSRVMRSALEYARIYNLPVIAHCEDTFLTAGALMNESYSSTRLGLKGTPAAAEEIAVARDVRLAELTGSRLHVAHVSTAGAVELIKKAKRKGVPVTAEASPHHLTLDDTMLETYDRNLKVNPPLRDKKDIEALRSGLREGTIDCIATDHAPHTEIDKQVEFDFAPPGIMGLETAFAQLNTELVDGVEFSLVDLIRLLTIKPAQTLSLPGGKLARGEPADLVLIDPDEEWVLEKAALRSKSSNTPLLGKKFRGRVQGVFLEGKWESAIL
ncbi:MAG: dihydroorotase [Candidatus Krumholzibacteriota bacterium]|nr:dihydroorotase [Candidatus Krumholzibacteriota bacterium]